jgi:hypothetical protein
LDSSEKPFYHEFRPLPLLIPSNPLSRLPLANSPIRFWGNSCKTVTVKLTPETAPLYQAAARQYRKLKASLHRLERLSASALRQEAKLVQSARRRT